MIIISEQSLFDNVKKGDFQSVKYILDHGNIKSERSVDWACYLGYFEICNYLLKKGLVFSEKALNGKNIQVLQFLCSS